MQNETHNQDTNTQVIPQEESPAPNETPQNQDIDPAVTMHPEDLLDPEGAEEPDPAVTMHPEDLLDPEPDPAVTMRPEDLFGPEMAEEPDSAVTMRPEDLFGPEMAEEPVIADWGFGLADWGFDPPSEEYPDIIHEPIEADPSEPVIADWGFGLADWGFDPPSEGPETIDYEAPSAEEAGRSDDSDPDIQGGCAFGLEYDEDLDACFPSDEQFDFFPVLFGEEPLPDTAGGYLALPGEAAGDVALGLGGMITGGGAYVEKALDWYGEDGGPIGLGFQGLGATIGFATETAGTIVSGAGEIVDGASDVVGDTVDAVGDAAEDAWDTVSGWF